MTTSVIEFGITAASCWKKRSLNYFIIIIIIAIISEGFFYVILLFVSSTLLYMLLFFSLFLVSTAVRDTRSPQYTSMPFCFPVYPSSCNVYMN
jgi:hypothetical protein